MANTAEQTRGFRVRERVVGRRADDDPVIRLEIYGILLLSFSVALLLALMSFDPTDLTASGAPRGGPAANAIGPVGAHVADLFLGLLGLGAFAATCLLGWLGATYLVGRRWGLTRADVLGWLGLLVGASVLLHVGLAPLRFLGHAPGGLLGGYTGEVAAALIGTAGAMILALTGILVSVIAVTRRSFFELMCVARQGAKAAGRGVMALLQHGDTEQLVDSELEAGTAGLPPGVAPPAEAPSIEPPAPRVEPDSEPPPPWFEPDTETRKTPNDEPRVVEPTPAAEERDGEPAVAESSANEARELAPWLEAPGEAIKIVESAAMRRRGELVVGEQPQLPELEEEKRYELPSMSLLQYKPPVGEMYDPEVLKEKAAALCQQLAHFKVEGHVAEIHPGPVVTMFEFKPAPGVKISKIVGLSDDLAMALKARSIRIVAPIPGKDVVGVEVPNEVRETVYLKECLSDAGFAKAKSNLTLALGKDIAGNPRSMDLAKAPHVLVAGATGSGKSVGINTFLCSLLYRTTPDEVRLILVDPKMVELSVYENIPHLLLPVVTDAKQAAAALRWAVREMERRYNLLLELNVRKLSEYNKKVRELLGSSEPRLPDKLRFAKARRMAAGTPDPEGVILDASGAELEVLPSIVVVVDEFADLMMQSGKDVEQCVARLAQKARAAGIHLILATQRPSTDVITGTIKSNFPTRISFRVSSGIDSRTILDQQGAEKLLGMGDMLCLAPGSPAPTRVHGCFVSDEEVIRIVDHVRAQGEPDYDMSIVAPGDDEGDESARSEEYDELYDMAVKVVAESRKASISFLQRKLGVGYNRAARIVEVMEKEGVVGPSDGTSRPREIFIDPI